MCNTKDSGHVSLLKEPLFEVGEFSLEHGGITEITDIKKTLMEIANI